MARKTKNIAEAIRARLAKDQDLAAAVSDERFSASVGQEILRVREECGMTQGQLAAKVGTHQSVIARLEDADYGSHSLRMLQRIAKAVGKRVAVRFVDEFAEQPTVVRAGVVEDGGGSVWIESKLDAGNPLNLTGLVQYSGFREADDVQQIHVLVGAAR